MRVHCIAGARPNFMKVAPLMRAFRARGTFDARLIHTGQHYDDSMSKVFFDDLGLPRPDRNLEVGSGPHGAQTARIMIAFEELCAEERPDLVLVVGDVNSTAACTLVAVKMGIRVGHVEAGLRSFDRRMPEEINRLVTDALADHLFTPSRDGDENLLREGVAKERIHFVGNVMVDTLLEHRDAAKGLRVADRFGLAAGRFSVVTLHRPSNVDDPAVLLPLVDALEATSQRFPVVFPLHPRTRERLAACGALERLGAMPDVHAIEPLGYLEFLSLLGDAGVVLTDSGGLQEETTVLGVPCLTLRENTERPVTITEGTNTLVGVDGERIVAAVDEIARTGGKRGRIPELWDGRAADRIVDLLEVPS